jgi:hypothetical protein
MEVYALTIQHSKADTIIVGAIAGLAAKTVHTILGWLVILLYPTYLNCNRIAAGLILTEVQVMQGGFLPFLIGLQIDFIVGMVVAFVTVLVLQHWGRDHYILKGAMAGLVSWALFYIVLSGLLSQVSPDGSMLHAEVAFFTHLLFGITLSLTAVWLMRRLERSE